MNPAKTPSATRRQPLRLWPGVVIVALQWLVRFGVPKLAPETEMVSLLGTAVLTLAFVIWWLFFSRAAWVERLGALALMVAALAVTPWLLHESLATAGMGVLFFIFAVPGLCLALILWAVVTRNLSDPVRRITMVVAILVACGFWTLLRTGGVSAAGSELAWRWSPTPEDRLLARGEESTVAAAPAVEIEREPDWPGFRGPRRDGVLTGVRIDSDWSTSPPVEIWRRPVGPGWSSFAVVGDLMYTQEQRGDDELVACYRVSSGEPVWHHRDGARFWESNAGAGPRATPTVSDGRVYTLGATGIVNALDAGDGRVLWSRDATHDTGAEVPGWGFSSSPLVIDELVFVYAGALVAYERDTGEPRWIGPTSGSYSSPHLVTVGGVQQVVMLANAGATGFSMTDGEVLWQNEWQSGIVQPASASNGDLLLSAGGMSGGLGLRRISVAHGADGWTTSELWTTNRLKPNFSDFVVHRGHAYGFDGAIMASLDLDTGERNWKGGRYGNGQLLLLADQDLLLVISERGDLALVSATPDRYSELARVQVLEGKSWNHPVLVGDRLVVRNGQEMAAYRLTLAGV